LQNLQAQLDRLNMDIETDTEVGEAFNVQAAQKKSAKTQE
jgi:outer membrane murein-binding lipoprotein Lpp